MRPASLLRRPPLLDAGFRARGALPGRTATDEYRRVASWSAKARRHRMQVHRAGFWYMLAPAAASRRYSLFRTALRRELPGPARTPRAMRPSRNRRPVLGAPAPTFRLAGGPQSCAVPPRRRLPTGAKRAGRCPHAGRRPRPGRRTCTCRLRCPQPEIPGEWQGRKTMDLSYCGMPRARAYAPRELATPDARHSPCAGIGVPRRWRRKEIRPNARPKFQS